MTPPTPATALREAHNDEETARRVMELVADETWAAHADLAAWTRVVKGIRGPLRAALAAKPPALDVERRELIEDAVRAAAQVGLYFPTLCHAFGISDPIARLTREAASNVKAWTNVKTDLNR